MSARYLAVLWVAATLQCVQAQVAEAGALAKHGKWEVSVDFEENVSRNSVIDINNYSFPGAPSVSIESIRYVEHNNAVVLTVTGLRTNDLFSVQVSNLRTTNNIPIPELTEGFVALPFSWAAIGEQELGFTPDVVVIGTNNFDLVSGGSVMRDEYDESTFVYEAVEGDFDKKVRIQFQEPSSIEARAGLMVREAVDENKSRPLDPEDPTLAFSRYIQVHANPAQTAYSDAGGPVPGNNLFQINVRPYIGTTESLVITNNMPPPGSNTWVRLRRVGELFEAFWGNNGTNWTLLASYTFPTNDFADQPLPAFSTNAFVGPNYAPEVGNIPLGSGARRSFLAQFRGYDDTGFVPSDPPTMQISRVGNEVELTWEGGGTLQSTTNLVTGPWGDVQGASPIRAVINKPYEFFRVRIP